MGRRAIGSRAMSGAERQARYLAAKLASAAAPRRPPANDGLVLKLEHVSRWPERTAPWVCHQLGRDAAVAFRDAMSRAIESSDLD